MITVTIRAIIAENKQVTAEEGRTLLLYGRISVTNRQGIIPRRSAVRTGKQPRMVARRTYISLRNLYKGRETRRVRKCPTG